jgi:uncharacterized protein
MNPATSAPDNLPWWKEPMVWLIIALPVTAVVASFITLSIAIKHADDIVTLGYVKSGMAVTPNAASQQEAARRGLAGALTYKEGLLTLQLQGDAEPAEALSLTLAHPTQDSMDIKIPLEQVSQGNYQARIELSGQGKRLLILEPASQSWRLQGEWIAPFIEETSLHAGMGSGV